MKKHFLLFTLLLAAFVLQSHAQFKLPKVLLAIHGQYIAPTGYFKDYYKFGAGAEATVGVGLGRTMITGTVGYGAFKQTDAFTTDDLMSYIPVRIGVRQYFVKQFFINAGAGVAILDSDSFDKTKANFSAEGGLGVKLAGFELIANYGGFKDKDADKWLTSFFLKAGYSFKL